MAARRGVERVEDPDARRARARTAAGRPRRRGARRRGSSPPTGCGRRRERSASPRRRRRRRRRRSAPRSRPKSAGSIFSAALPWLSARAVAGCTAPRSTTRWPRPAMASCRPAVRKRARAHFAAEPAGAVLDGGADQPAEAGGLCDSCHAGTDTPALAMPMAETGGFGGLKLSYRRRRSTEFGHGMDKLDERSSRCCAMTRGARSPISPPNSACRARRCAPASPGSRPPARSSAIR